MSDRKGRVETVCPCCRNRLTVDVATGEVLAEQRAKKDLARSFEEAMGAVRQGSSRREQAFSDAFQRTRNQDEVLEKKFEEARKKAKDDPAKPHSPFDLD